MAELAAKLHGVDTTQSIRAIKALRTVTGGTLRWAKMDVYDKVRDGYSVVVPVRDVRDVEDLAAHGWYVSKDENGVVAFAARIPASKAEDLAAIVRALGGTVESER